MWKLRKYLKKSAGIIVLIMGLLILQAYCDLELPNYTSKIVTTGIQQKGIESGLPDRMREETYEDLKLFVKDETAALMDSAYHADGGLYVLGDLPEQERTVLAEALTEAEIIMMVLRSDDLEGTLSSYMSEDGMTAANGAEGESESTDISAGGYNVSELLTTIPEGTSVLETLRSLPAQFREIIINNAAGAFDSIPDMLREQMTIQFAANEYEAIGEDPAARQNRYLVQTGAKMLLLAFLAMAANVLVAFLAARTAAGTAHDLRNDLYRKIIGFNSEEFHRFSTASLITRSTNDVQQVQMLLAMGMRILLYAPILGIGGVLHVIQTDVSLSWTIALAIALILILILLLFKIAMPKFRSLQTLIDRLNLVTREQLTGVMVTRAFSAERSEEERFEKASLELTRTNLFVNRCMTFMMPAMMLILNGVSILIVYTGAHAIDRGQLQVGDMMAFIQYAMQIIMSFLMISMMSIIIPRAGVAAKRIGEVLETEPSITDPAQPEPLRPEMAGTVEFDHVSFAYPDAEENVLTDISFTAAKGETVAFIGSTGSGKSTLVNLIPRFYDVTEGCIRVDGVDVRRASRKALRAAIGYVPQKSLLFTGTIDSNIRFGRPDATADEVKKAAEIAQAVEFIEEKPDQYNSAIAQGGSNVSGGQRQRLSIARAIAKNPEILIFDDSFSALDFKTDAALRKALKEQTKDVTTLIVAQRISTILHADRIIVLDEGRVAGMGTHRQLMESCEVYRQIAGSQLSKEELAG